MIIINTYSTGDSRTFQISDAVTTNSYDIPTSQAVAAYVAANAGGGAWGDITGTLSAQTDLQSALNAKQATLVSATNIKTVNGNSLVGSGDVVVSSGGTPYKKIVGFGVLNNSGDTATLTIYENDTIYTNVTTAYAGDGIFDVYFDGNPNSNANLLSLWNYVVFATPIQKGEGEMQNSHMVYVNWKDNGVSFVLLKKTVTDEVIDSATLYQVSFCFEIRLYTKP